MLGACPERPRRRATCQGNELAPFPLVKLHAPSPSLTAAYRNSRIKSGVRCAAGFRQAARLRLFLSSLPDNTETPAKPAICPGEYMPASSIACRSSRQASHVAKSRLHGSSVTKYYAHSQRMTQSAMRSTRACTMKSPFRAKPVFESIDLDQNRLLDRKVIITKAGRDRE